MMERYTVNTIQVRLKVAETMGGVRGPVDAARIVSDAVYRDLDADQEHFIILALDTKNHVIGYKVIASGAMDHVSIDPRLVFRAALRLEAAAIILVHNHPSGSPEPSGDDLRITARLVEGGKMLGMGVLDHLILGNDRRYVSLQERGAL